MTLDRKCGLARHDAPRQLYRDRIVGKSGEHLTIALKREIEVLLNIGLVGEPRQMTDRNIFSSGSNAAPIS
jgi:hypothetical protein